jgi:hypothetical protein
MAGYTSRIVTTVGGSKSNSFITASEATTILTNSAFDATEWSTLTQSKQESLLIMAAEAMDYLMWKGYRVYDQQSLCFPRSIQWDLEILRESNFVSVGNRNIDEITDFSNLPPITEIPIAIEEAQALMAFLVSYRGVVSMSPASEGIPGQAVTRVSLGGMLDVAFSQIQPVEMSRLINMVRFPDFPVYLKLRRYLTSWKMIIGRSPNVDPPRKFLPKVD